MNNLKEEIKNYKPYNEQEEADKALMLNYIDTFDDVLTRDNKMCHFTASNWIVNKTRDKVLMCFHKTYNSWAWTGGHCDGDSDLEHVARKELEEETGLKDVKLLSDGIYAIEILGVKSHIKRGNYVPTHVHLDCCFLFEADDSVPLRIKEDENSGLKWVNIDEAVKITSEPEMVPIYQKLNDKIQTLKD